MSILDLFSITDGESEDEMLSRWEREAELAEETYANGDEV